MSSFDETTLQALEATATASAAYLDICDSGVCDGGPDPEYYRLCGGLLMKIFTLVEADSYFPELLRSSAAAREVAEVIRLSQWIEEARLGMLR